MKELTVGDTLVALEPIVQSVDDVADLLTDADLAELSTIANSRRQLERATVLSIVRRVFGIKVSIDHDPDGSPVIKGREGFISISHSRQHAVVAFNPSCRIGVDTETWRDQLTRVTDKFLSAAEREVYADNDLLLRAWTIKEAVYKAAGIAGLSLSDGIVLDVNDTSATVATAILPGGITRRFVLHFLQSPAGSATTLAIPAHLS